LIECEGDKEEGCLTSVSITKGRFGLLTVVVSGRTAIWVVVDEVWSWRWWDEELNSFWFYKVLLMLCAPIGKVSELLQVTQMKFLEFLYKKYVLPDRYF
jgi:hypothetical protein